MMNSNVGSWTEAQRKMLFSLMGKVDFAKEDMEASLKFPMSQLSVSEASALIDCLKNSGDLSEVVRKIREDHATVKGPLDQVPEKPVNSPVKAQVEPPALKSEPSGLSIPRSPEEAMQRKAESPMKVEKPSSRPQLMAKLNGIPEELADMYFAIIDGALYIKNPGLLYMASKKGYAKIEVTSEPDGKGGFTAISKIYPKIPIDFIKAITPLSPEIQLRLLDDQYGPTVEKGSANKENVKNSRMYSFFEELARTRANDRALRLYTGYGGTSYEELPDAQLESDRA